MGLSGGTRGGAGGSGGIIFVGGPSGRGIVVVPAGWTCRLAVNGKGAVYQRPGALGNADSIRIMEPTGSYPHGYVRIYNARGQPVDLQGRPGGRSATHLPLP